MDALRGILLLGTPLSHKTLYPYLKVCHLATLPRTHFRQLRFDKDQGVLVRSTHNAGPSKDLKLRIDYNSKVTSIVKLWEQLVMAIWSLRNEVAA